ncbi:MAG TPA: NAD(P)/FAD-dependent oxidoreductase, partial [Stellaceae bacterium]|nr:NAD(P)/FAD-dependent oxidoreductase [Stellaceae bacterium]
KGLLESYLRDRHIKWITNAKLDRCTADKMFVTEHDEDGAAKRTHELPYKFATMIPAFRGIAALNGANGGIAGLTNPRGFVIVDKHQRNPTFRNVFSVGVCIAIPPVEKTPVPVGVPKTGYMIESMVTATARNLREIVAGREAAFEPTWNAVCLADFGDGGVAFVALPQIPPRNVNWSSEGYWVHLAKLGFEKYFLRRVRQGATDPFYEKFLLKALGIEKLRSPKPVQAPKEPVAAK